MPRTRTLLTAGALSAALTLSLTTTATTTATAAPVTAARDTQQVVWGLAENGTALVRFNLARPQDTRRIADITRLRGGDTRLVGVDGRVQDGLLYGVGDNGGVYRVAPRGVARLVNTVTVPLEGTNFLVDFNPAANRLRIVSDTGQNLRHDVSGEATPATTVDTPLSTPPAGPGTGVTAGAYTNNDLDDTTGTTLFVVNTETDQLMLQSPANSGTLAAVGSLGRAVGPSAGMDIGAGNKAYATFAAPGRYRLFEIDLLTGRSTPMGYFPVGVRVDEIALQIP